MLITQDISLIAQQVITGGVIAYPTEAVFGLGCDPANLHAVQRLLEIKRRPAEKGLILIASHFDQVLPYLADDIHPSAEQMQAGNITWVFPAKAETSTLLRGHHDTLAIRVTRHPLVRALCDQLSSALISTSANLTGEAPCYTAQAVLEQFQQHANQPDAVLDGPTSGQLNPTEIRDAISGTTLRHS